MSRPDFDPIGRGSTGDFIREVSRGSLIQMDLNIPTSRARIIEKARDLQASAIFAGDRVGLLAGYPTVNAVFQFEMLRNLIGSPDDLNPTITGEDIVTAYELAVESTAAFTTRQLRQGLFMPDSYGRVLDHFGVPIASGIIDKVEDTQLAETYRQRTIAWTQA